MRIIDVVRELRIRWHKGRMLAAETARRRHHDRFVRLIKGRSAQAVARMEKGRGLA